MKLPSERSPIQAAGAAGDRGPPKAAVVAPAASMSPSKPSVPTTGPNSAPATTLTGALAQPPGPVEAKGPPTAARGDDDLMSQGL